MPTSIAGFWALDSAVIAFTLGIFLFGAFIKGAIGVGLPLVAIPVLSMFIPPQQAIGLLALPGAWHRTHYKPSRAVRFGP